MAAELQRLGVTDPVFVTNYQWTAILRFYRIDARQIDGATRPSHFTQVPEQLAGRDRAYVFADGFLQDGSTASFDTKKILAKFPLVVRGEEVGVLWLLEYSRSGGTKGHATATVNAGRLDQTPSIRPP